MKKVRIVTEYITLGQFLKFVNLIGNGGEVKEYLSRNMIIVNGEEENRRGRKLYSKDQVIVGNEKYEIVDMIYLQEMSLRIFVVMEELI